VPAERVLIVEDEGIVRMHLERIALGCGFQVVASAASAEAAEEAARRTPPDLVLMDIHLQGPVDGVEAACRLRSRHDAGVVFITAHADDATLARAQRAEPLGYLVKPFEAVDVKAALVTASAARERRAAGGAPSPGGPQPQLGMIGNSRAFVALLEQIPETARGEWTVLIQGETGAGKELVAQAVHRLSPRHAQPFLAVNCANLSETLIGSQLFGHRRGGFPGVHTDHKGYLEAAQGGTLFLDEVAELPLPLQASLLRVLEERTILPLGASRPVSVDVRILAATHRKLEEEVERGAFRRDLLYRLRVARLELPPLRERGDDLFLLAHTFLEQARAKTGKVLEGFEPAALEQLRLHPWPGNVRELRSAVDYAAIRSRGPQIRLEDLPPEIQRAARPMRIERPPDDLDKALRTARGNRSGAARLLGISRATLYRRLERLKGTREPSTKAPPRHPETH
jgi:DNA-binding NtrC family response regulator